MVLTLDETKENRAKIKVVGVGGAGGNALNRMIESGLHGVEFIAINTDAMALENNLAERKISIGQKLCKGLGAGSRPDKGYEAIQEDRKLVEEALSGADMVFIAGGMGGGTGTGAAPVVADISRELGILTVGVVTEPFNWEGPVRRRHSKRGLMNLSQNVDTIIAIQNQKIFDVIPKNTTVLDAYKTVDGVLMDAVKGISDIILNHGFMQVDFADVREIMTNGGEALIGTGIAEGEGKARLAAELAIHSPLLDDISISGAGGLLVNITGGDELAMHEINEVMTYIYECVGDENEPHIIFGNVIDSAMGEKVAVTVIATGFAAVENERIEPEKPQATIPAQTVVEKPIQPDAEEHVIEAPAMEIHTPEAPVAPELPEEFVIEETHFVSETEETSFESAYHFEKNESDNDQSAQESEDDEKIAPTEVVEKSQVRFDTQDIHNESVHIKSTINEEHTEEQAETFKQPDVLDVRSSEVEETVVSQSKDLPSYYKELQDAEQSHQANRPTQRMQELTSSFVDENIDYSKPAFQRNGGSGNTDHSQSHNSHLGYDSDSSEIDETPAFLRIHE